MIRTLLQRMLDETSGSVLNGCYTGTYFNQFICHYLNKIGKHFNGTALVQNRTPPYTYRNYYKALHEQAGSAVTR
jgi:hypothetical protein